MAIDNQTQNAYSGTGTQAVVGLFTDANDAQRALGELREAGFRSSQIGAAFRNSGRGSYGNETVSGRDAYRNDTIGTPTSVDDPGTATAPGNYVGTGSGSYAGTGTSDYATTGASDYSTPGTSDYSTTDRARQAGHSAAGHAENWWEKVKHFFGDDDDDANRSADRTATGYGTATTGPAATGTGGSLYSTSSNYGSDTGTYGNDYDYDYNDQDFMGSLAGVGIPQERARSLASQLGPGGAIITVNASDRAQEAENILERNNARIRHEDVSGSSAYGTGAGTTAFGSSVGTSTGTAATEYADAQTEPRRNVAGSAADLRGQDRIQLFGEVLRVHKDRINRGEVVVRKEVVTETQNIQVPVTREEFVMERVPVAGDRPAPGDVRLGDNKEIRVPLTEERVRVEKQPVVREEVVVGKREITDNESVGDQVAHEELRVDDKSKGVAREGNLRDSDVDDPVRRRPA